MPQVKQFDTTEAKKVLKTCPQIVQDYVKLLEKVYEKQKELTALAISKLRQQ